MPYTLPAIIHKSSITSNPHGAMMDSLPIVLHLDKAFPQNPLFPSGDASYALMLAVEKIAGGAAPALRSMILPRVPEKLDPRGQEYFIRTRSEWFGKPLAETLVTDEVEVKKLYELVEKEMQPVLDMLKGREGKKGPFFEGEKAGYVDLMLACRLAFIERFDTPLFEKTMALGNGELKALYEACRSWLEGQGEEKEWPIPQ